MGFIFWRKSQIINNGRNDQPGGKPFAQIAEGFVEDRADQAKEDAEG